MMTTCLTCRSTNRNMTAHGCHNPWHKGLHVHFRRASIVPLCATSIDDAWSELADAWDAVTCPICLAQSPACDRTHSAPSCVDPACHREEAARKADDILPGLGALVRSGKLSPMPTSVEPHPPNEWRDPATIIQRPFIDHPRSIKAAFQDMLRIAYQAGVASATTGEIFETWYQREVRP